MVVGLLFMYSFVNKYLGCFISDTKLFVLRNGSQREIWQYFLGNEQFFSHNSSFKLNKGCTKTARQLVYLLMEAYYRKKDQDQIKHLALMHTNVWFALEQTYNPLHKHMFSLFHSLCNNDKCLKFLDV